MEEEYDCQKLPEDYCSFDLSFKILLIGDSGVGKSSIITKAIKNTYDDSSIATIGFEFFQFISKIHNKVIKLNIYDTCGMETYHSLITSFYRNSLMAIIVYSVDNFESFNHVNTWLNEVKTQSNPDVRIFLIGNKADNEDKRIVTFEQGKQLAEENKMDFFMETSAKTGLNAQELFIEATRILYKQYLQYKDIKNLEFDEPSISTNYLQCESKSSRNTKNVGCC